MQNNPIIPTALEAAATAGQAMTIAPALMAAFLQGLQNGYALAQNTQEVKVQ